MPPSRELLAVLSAETRFQPDVLEKVLRLIELLKEIDGHPLLGPKLVLKGGTALNLFHLDLPRISVDLDFNYTGRLEREMMLEERPKVERATELVAASLGYPAQRTGIEDAHAGTRWVLTYAETGGSTDHLEVSINWIHRVPILNSERRRVRQIHPAFSTEATLLALEELYAGKVAALLDRAQPRDLFDVAQLVSQQARLDQRALREVSLFYLGMGLEDPRRLGLAHVLELSDRAIRLRLSPLMRRDEQPSRETLLKVVRPHLEALLRLSGREQAFFDAIGRGELLADRIFTRVDVQERAARSPAMQWKLLNVREHLAGRHPPTGRRRGRPPRRKG